MVVNWPERYMQLVKQSSSISILDTAIEHVQNNAKVAVSAVYYCEQSVHRLRSKKTSVSCGKTG